MKILRATEGRIPRPGELPEIRGDGGEVRAVAILASLTAGVSTDKREIILLKKEESVLGCFMAPLRSAH